MRLNKMFGDLFDKILNSKDKRKELLKIIKKYHKNNLLDNELALCLIKSLILILSYHPNKIDNCINIIKKYSFCNKLLQNDIFKCLKNYNLNNQFNLSDEIVEKIIYNTIIFLENIYLIAEDQIYSIWFLIINNVKKLNKINPYIKVNLYLILLKESNKILDKYNTKSYLKITELCNNVVKLVNNF